MSLIVTDNLRNAIKNGEPLSWPVLSSFLAGALPHFWDECSGLAELVRRNEKRPRIDTHFFPEEPARQILLGMALIGYRRAIAKHLRCGVEMPNQTAVVALAEGERLSEPPCAAYLPVVLRNDRPSGFAFIQTMVDALDANPSFIVRDIRDIDGNISRDLHIICRTDPYRRAVESALGMRMAMQYGRIAMKRHDVESREFDRFCSVDELIVTWPNKRLVS